MKFRVASLAALVVGALIFALVALGAPKHVSKASAAGSQSCYPTNEFTAHSGQPFGPGGAFTASTKGNGVTSMTSSGDLPGTAGWNLNVKVTGNAGSNYTYSPGTMSGSLNVVWRIAGSSAPTRFVSSCITEAWLLRTPNPPTDDGETEIEVEFEGTAYNAPWGGGPAVATAVFETQSANGSGRIINFKVEMSTGPTCSEGSGSNEFTMEGPVEGTDPSPNGFLTTSPKLNPAGEERSRMALPAPYTATSRCSDVF